MHTIFFIARLYPYIAIPLVLICIELSIFFRRQRNSAQYFFWIMSAFFLGSAFLWVGFRGDLNSDQWVRSLLG